MSRDGSVETWPVPIKRFDSLPPAVAEPILASFSEFPSCVRLPPERSSLFKKQAPRYVCWDADRLFVLDVRGHGYYPMEIHFKDIIAWEYGVNLLVAWIRVFHGTEEILLQMNTVGLDLFDDLLTRLKGLGPNPAISPGISSVDIAFLKSDDYKYFTYGSELLKEVGADSFFYHPQTLADHTGFVRSHFLSYLFLRNRRNTILLSANLALRNRWSTPDYSIVRHFTLRNQGETLTVTPPSEKSGIGLIRASIGNLTVYQCPYHQSYRDAVEAFIGADSENMVRYRSSP